MRHHELHPDPQVLAMPAARGASAHIELGEHEDGSWMWAVSLYEGAEGFGYSCAAKWQRFAATHAAALEAAIAEGMERTERAAKGYRTVRAWLASLRAAQGDLFA